MNTLYTHDEITIQAPASEVWAALINPNLTRKYMFGCEVICNWEKGTPLLWKGAEDGVIYVKGTLLDFEPGEKLSFTVFDPNANYEDVPSNYLTATYTLESNRDVTLLNVTQGDYAAVADGEKRYQDTMAQGGWSAVLQTIKSLAENKTSQT
uniref:SRPBCC domain-containing protein n=1 Tax=Roseihalotalea indica TaxID=2867963 RepID=A0AA49GS35_9BACT|nr:SRPBCC domain-containing protein [Tunicatimonas sp. TK19036]